MANADQMITPEIYQVCEWLSEHFGSSLSECLEVIKSKKQRNKLKDLKPVVPQTTCTQQQKQLFAKIEKELKLDASTPQGQARIKGWATKAGNTQESERQCIEYVRSVLDKLDLTYECAGSQQAKDFRNIGGIGLLIEVKKLKSKTIMLNDTPPQPHVYYVIFHTTDPCQKNPLYKPQVVCCIGADMMPPEEANRIRPAHDSIHGWRELLGKGGARKNRLQAFPRMNYNYNIEYMLIPQPKAISLKEMKKELKKHRLLVPFKSKEKYDKRHSLPPDSSPPLSELKTKCMEKGLATSGTKVQLTERLKQAEDEYHQDT